MFVDALLMVNAGRGLPRLPGEIALQVQEMLAPASIAVMGGAFAGWAARALGGGAHALAAAIELAGRLVAASRAQACLEDIKYGARRELDKAQLRQLATCLWVHQHHNILIAGMMTGTGKTFVGCALTRAVD